MRLVFSRRVDAGFTLIEVVVALAIVALSLTFVLPRLTSWIDRFRFYSGQQRFEDALADLPSEARRAGHTIILRSSGSVRPKPADEAVIELPLDWLLEITPPIVYRYDGLCTGGTVRLIFPAGPATYRLAAPYCRPQPL